MKLKDLLMPLGLTLLTFWGINYFWGGKKASPDGQMVKSGQSFVAPKTKLEYKPLHKEIDFIDEKRPRKAVATTVETDLVKILFTSEGASIERVEIKRSVNSKQLIQNTVFPVGQHERENKCFLIALDEKTPFYYQFLGKDETTSEINVRYRYQSPNSDVAINKTYTIFKETHKLNLTIEVDPKSGLEEGVVPRIFFPAPLTPEIPGGASIVVMNEKGSIERKSGGKIDEQRGWFKPAMFGGETKYFLHTMVEDQDNFVQRAYYRDACTEKLFAILEGPSITEKTSWTVSFYVGPKEEVAMARVDERLEKTLDYSGILAPISKFLLAILKFFYKHFGNYGLAIILLTLLIKLILLPFTIRAEKGMKKTREMQKKLKYIEQKYKNDKETLNRMKAESIRKTGLGSLGGCLPALLQMPIFFAFSRMVSSSIEFYQAPFVFWIKDLSLKDPYYVLPAIMVVSMLLQAVTGEKSQRFTFVAIAFVFGAFLANLSAGLVLYISVSTLLGVVQTVIQRRVKAA